MKQSGLVVDMCIQMPTGPGFESQVPIFLVIFSIHVIKCRSRLGAHHTPSDIKRQMAQGQIWQSRNDGLWWDLVNQCTQNQESQTRPACDGPQNCYQDLQNQAQTSNSFYFLFILFICLFNYFYY